MYVFILSMQKQPRVKSFRIDRANYTLTCIIILKVSMALYMVRVPLLQVIIISSWKMFFFPPSPPPDIYITVDNYLPVSRASTVLSCTCAERNNIWLSKQ